jgi:hypothetical protein
MERDMPVNMDPSKRKRKQATSEEASTEQSDVDVKETGKAKFGEETEQDREKAIAEAEWKNLWDATEVIDMDTW